jgi:hypothetical protein
MWAAKAPQTANLNVLPAHLVYGVFSLVGRAQKDTFKANVEQFLVIDVLQAQPQQRWVLHLLRNAYVRQMPDASH